MQNMYDVYVAPLTTDAQEGEGGLFWGYAPAGDPGTQLRATREIGPVPPRDRSASAPRSVQFRLEIGPLPPRDRSSSGSKSVRFRPEPDDDDGLARSTRLTEASLGETAPTRATDVATVSAVSAIATVSTPPRCPCHTLGHPCVCHDVRVCAHSIDHDERMLRIGTFSTLSRISVRMLRYYQEHDVLVPARTDPFSGYRYYRPSSWSMRIWSYNCVTRASPSRQSRSSWSAQIQPGSRRRSPHNAPNSYVSRTPCEDSFSPWIASAPH